MSQPREGCFEGFRTMCQNVRLRIYGKINTTSRGLSVDVLIRHGRHLPALRGMCRSMKVLGKQERSPTIRYSRKRNYVDYLGSVLDRISSRLGLLRRTTYHIHTASFRYPMFAAHAASYLLQDFYEAQFSCSSHTLSQRSLIR
jgi:hypothetical protein